MYSFRTMLIHVNYPAWYTVVSEDGRNWYATLATFQYYHSTSPHKMLHLDKDIMLGWLFYSIKFNEIGMENLRSCQIEMLYASG
jgi:hypothetical protein